MDKLTQELAYLEVNLKWLLAYIFDLVRSKKCGQKICSNVHCHKRCNVNFYQFVSHIKI